MASINLALFNAYLIGWEVDGMTKVCFLAFFLNFFIKDIAKIIGLLKNGLSIPMVLFVFCRIHTSLNRYGMSRFN